MPTRDRIHDTVKQALIKDGWEITDDPYIIDYGERILYADLGIADGRQINGKFLGVQSGKSRIIIEIKEFRGRSKIADLEQAIGQYVLYRLLLAKIAPSREIYLAVPTTVYEEIFSEEIGQVVINDLPMKLLVVQLETEEVKQWIPLPNTGKFSSR
ncbi:XisH family protein [Limnofasciculus baicalensis]|uniref:XisH family protein n=1 Tax=Limnofasciculus baicalensis BBK-W-15 TaxID=2699891 RepID=A0AAE3KV54_9CYAN|nr:XisH family protein [Limnofasciculus baicalensis]MCP2732227.1 XisH family protein [Limnofasciculus baicalensis BBK-W-15]